MKAKHLLSYLESYQTYQGLKKDMEDIFTQVTFDPVKDKADIDQINSIINDHAQSMSFEQEAFDEECGFHIDLALVDRHYLYAALKEIKEESAYLNGMSEAWESDDPFAMAENDPGLQFEQGNKVENLWDDFNNKFNNTIKQENV